MDRNVFSYANTFFFKGEGLPFIWLSTEGGRRVKEITSPRLENAYSLSPLRSKACLQTKTDLVGREKRSVCSLPKQPSSHSMSQDHRPEMQTQVEGWDVSEEER